MKFVVLCLALFAISAFGQGFLDSVNSAANNANQAASSVNQVTSTITIPSGANVPSTDAIQQSVVDAITPLNGSVPSLSNLNQTVTDAVNSAVANVNQDLNNITVPSVDVNQTLTDAGQNINNIPVPAIDVNQTLANAGQDINNITVPAVDVNQAVANAGQNINTIAVPAIVGQTVADVDQAIANDDNTAIIGDDIDFDNNLEGFYVEGEVFTSEYALSEGDLNEYSLTAEQGEFDLYSDEDGLLNGWNDIDTSAVETDADLKSALDFGFENVVTALVNNATIPSDGEYAISEIYDIKSQVVAGMNYQFHVQAHNGNATYLDLLYTVYSVVFNGTQEVTESSYRVYTA